MNCLEFRRAAGADPRHLRADAIGHRDGCPQCAAYVRQLLVMDVTILKALQVQGPAERSSARPVPPRAREVARAVLGNRNRWYALAASVVGGVLVGVLLWASGSRNALARDVLGHVAHEPQALVTTQVPVGADRVRDILAKDGLRLRSDMGLVSYAMSCPFRGHEVPHLVVQTAGGPVTVLVLRDEKVTRVMRFHEQGYVGTLEPAGPGSIAVIGSSPAQVKEAAERVAAALEWTTP
jgi:hypothetical protein